MSSTNRYDVTAWPVGDPFEDIGEVINSIIADIKAPADGHRCETRAENQAR